MQATKQMTVLVAFVVWMLAGFRGYAERPNANPVVACGIISNTFVNCSHRSLKTVPNATFPGTTEKLDLSFNKLTHIDGFTFGKLCRLKWLDLSYNDIVTFDKDALANLYRLMFLNINSNELKLSSSTYNPELFKPLQNLRILHMEDNVCRTRISDPNTYPTAIAVLSNLRELYTDFSPYLKFTQQFTNLKKLKTLSSSGFILPNRKHPNHCCVKALYNYTFLPFRTIRLKKFRLAYSCLSQIQQNVFEPFKYVQSFELIGNQQLGLYSSMLSMYGLQNQTIPRLSLKGENNYIRRNKSDFEPNYLSTRFLRTICVQSLDISENFLHFITPPYFSRPDCLRGLDMSVHISDPMYLIKKLLKDKPFPNLQFLNISTGHMDSQKPPTPLTYTDVTALSSKSTLKLNLHTADVSYVPMKCEFSSPYFHSLKVLNISGWNCSIAAPYLFLELVNVTHLSARQANLNIGFARQYPEGSILRNMINLEMIDLAGNDLTILPKDLFLTTHKLKTVLLSNNKLTNLPMKVFETKSLVYLDLWNNAIHHLNPLETELIDTQRQRIRNFTISLASNPFVCNCRSLKFLQWLNETDVVDDFGPDYVCRFGEEDLVPIATFMKDFKSYSVSCISNSWLRIGIVSLLVLIVLIVILIMYYRHRWNIHYWFYTNCRPSPDMLPQKKYEYDAFVCYNHNDYEWVYRSLKPFLEDGDMGIRLCLHHRDFEVGEVIQQNIVDAVNRSRKIILVITNNFVRSTWGEYEIEMAGMRSVHEGRTNVIISVLLEEVPVREMPRSLMNLWHRVTFLAWPQTERERNLFWERLANALK